MKQFFLNNWGYFLGIALTPITWKIFETFERKFKTTKHLKTRRCIKKS